MCVCACVFVCVKQRGLKPHPDPSALQSTHVVIDMEKQQRKTQRGEEDGLAHGRLGGCFLRMDSLCVKKCRTQISFMLLPGPVAKPDTVGSAKNNRKNRKRYF